MNMAKRFFAVFLTVALVALGSLARAEAPAALVKVDEVKRQPLMQTVPIIGRLVARRAGIVASRSAGPVAEVKVQVGDRVETGDVLALLVTDSLQATLQLRQAELKQARQRLKRLENLRRSRSAAFARARDDDTMQDVAKAVANLRSAEIELANAEIRAPYRGVVTVRHTEAGAYLKVGDSVVTMVNDRDLEIEADVPSKRVHGLTAGRQITIEFEDGSRHRVTVRTVVPEENPMTRTRVVRLVPSFKGSTNGLAVNQSVTVHVPVGEPRDVISVHKDGVIHRQGKYIVFVVEGDAVQIRTVTLGEAVGSRFEVLTGLKAGDLVVVRGNERLRSGQKVRTGKGS